MNKKEFAESLIEAVPRSNSQQKELIDRKYATFSDSKSVAIILNENVRNITFFISMGKIVNEDGNIRFEGSYYHGGVYLESHINIFTQMIEDDLDLLEKLSDENVDCSQICREWNFEVVITDALQEYNYWKEQWEIKHGCKEKWSDFDDILLAEDSTNKLGSLKERQDLRKKIVESAKKTWGEDGINHEKFKKLSMLNDTAKGKIKVNLKYTFWSDDIIEKLKKSEDFNDKLKYLRECFIRGAHEVHVELENKRKELPDLIEELKLAEEELVGIEDMVKFSKSEKKTEESKKLSKKVKASKKNVENAKRILEGCKKRTRIIEDTINQKEKLTIFDMRYIFEEAIIFYLNFNDPKKKILHSYPGIIKKAFGEALVLLASNDENVLRACAIDVEHISAVRLEELRVGRYKNGHILGFMYASVLEGKSDLRIEKRKELLQKYYIGKGIITYKKTDTNTMTLYKAFCQHELSQFYGKRKFQCDYRIPLRGKQSSTGDTVLLLDNIIIPFLEADKQNGACLMVLGKSGTGKSSFAETLGAKVWSRNWNHQANKTWIPLKIDLKSLPIQLKKKEVQISDHNSDHFEDIIKEYLRNNLKIEESEISDQLVLKLPLLLILDGYDDVKELIPNFYEKFGINRYKNVRIIATCVDEFYLQNIEINLSAKYFCNFPSVEDVDLAEISLDAELDGYFDALKKFDDEMKELNSEYKEVIKKTKGEFRAVIKPHSPIYGLASNLLILEILVENISFFKYDDNTGEFTIVDFFNTLFQNTGEKYHLINLKKFLEALVQVMVTSESNFRLNEKQIKKIQDDFSDEYLYKNSFIKYLGSGVGKYLEFHHGLVRDYILSVKVLDDVRRLKIPPNEYGVSIDKSIISQMKIKDYFSILQMLGEQINDSHKEKLIEIVNYVRRLEKPRSKTWCVASSNAMSILVCSHYNFSGMDLSKVEAEDSVLNGMAANSAVLAYANFTGASLVGAYCDGTNFERSDFTNANLSRIWLRGASLKRCKISNPRYDKNIFKHYRASIQDINFGQLPFIYCSDIVETVALESSSSVHPQIVDYIINYKHDIVAMITENTVIIWRLFTGECDRILSADRTTFTSIAYSEGSRKIVLGTTNKGICWVDPLEPVLKYYSSQQGSVEDVSISEEGSSIAAAYSNGSILLIDPNAEEIKLLYLFKPGIKHRIAINSSGRKVVASDRNVLWVFDIENGIILNIVLSLGNINDLSIAKDANIILVSSDTGVYICDLVKREFFSISTAPVLSASISSDGSTVAWSDGNEISVINTSTGEAIAVIKNPTTVSNIQLSGNGDVISAQSTKLGDPLLFWHPARHRYHPKQESESLLKYCALTLDMNTLVSLYGNGKIKLMNLKNRKGLIMQGPHTVVDSAFFLYGKNYISILVGGYSEKQGYSVFFYDLLEYNTKLLDVFETKVISISSGIDVIAIGCADKKIYIYRGDSKIILEDCDIYHPQALALKSNGTELAYAASPHDTVRSTFSCDVSVMSFDDKSVKELIHHSGYTEQVVYSLDGSVMAAMDNMGGVEILIFQNKKVVKTVIHKDSGFLNDRRIDLSEKGDLLLISNNQFKYVIVYFVKLEELTFCEFLQFDDYIKYIKFTPIGFNFIIGFSSGEIQLWGVINSRWTLQYSSKKYNSVLMLDNADISYAKISSLNRRILCQQGAYDINEVVVSRFVFYQEGEDELRNMRRLAIDEARKARQVSDCKMSRVRRDVQGRYSPIELIQNCIENTSLSKYPFSKDIRIANQTSGCSTNTLREYHRQCDHRAIKLLAASRGSQQLGILKKMSYENSSRLNSLISEESLNDSSEKNSEEEPLISPSPHKEELAKLNYLFH
ncbi:MAG: pentapeptide repeat-containing protein [Gammaproteobacteria bacterium]|nr:pentapeptide repeat-containing protein [Gammaproteobacteria bacterium]